jgi:phage terminase large subunit-like protein
MNHSSNTHQNCTEKKETNGIYFLQIHQERVKKKFYQWIVVSVDPAISAHKNSAETGIIVSAKDNKDHYYILADLSGQWTVAEWIQKTIEAAHLYAADRVVAEINQGGDLVENLLKQYQSPFPFLGVRALRNKETRAAPVIALYQQKKITHMGFFFILECHMMTAHNEKKKELDRIDALVWSVIALTTLLEEERKIKPMKRNFFIN